MGAASSRVACGSDARSASRWTDLCVGLQYTGTDIALWPHCLTFAQWFTAQDAHVLSARLQRRAQTRFLTFTEFKTWLSVSMAASDIAAKMETALPIVPVDPSRLAPPCVLPVQAQTPLPPTPQALLAPELALQHLFVTFAASSTPSPMLHAMEFLAAMTIASTAIWAREEKERVLLELFQDAATAAPSQEALFTEPDVLQLLMCVMRGVAKVTIGVACVWRQHRVQISTLARTLATECMAFAIAQRAKGASESNATHRIAITASEFRAFVATKPALHRFLAMFCGEEVRNPFTFGSMRSPCDGLTLSKIYHDQVAAQTERYRSILRQYVTFEGRISRRQESAAILIQSTWRRRCSWMLLQQQRDQRHNRRMQSVSTVQGFVRRRRFASVLERHAVVELQSRNGAVFVAGQGVCRPSSRCRGTANVSCSPSTSMSSLCVIDELKLRSVRIVSIAISQTFVLALEDDRCSLFAWGRCIPSMYEGCAEMCLTQRVPMRLAHCFSAENPVCQLACGLAHALVLTEDGNLHSWGFNDHGQLGHGTATTLAARTNHRTQYARYYDERDGRESEYLARPTTLAYFQGSKLQQAEAISIRQVACGDYYTLALSADGDVFSWGDASEGQLGHGESHPRIQVGFVDTHMLQSAFTFIPEPEPILALSCDRMTQVACCKNHSIALTEDGRMFEWGNWGKRCGKDLEHAHVPIENPAVRGARMRTVSAGAHHTLTEGASAWLRVCRRNEELCGDRAVYMRWHGNFDDLETRFATKTWTCAFIDCDFDDLGNSSGNTDATQAPATASLWSRRVSLFALQTASQVAAYDEKIAQACRLSTASRYEDQLRAWFKHRVDNRFVVLPEGRHPGVYIQLLLPVGVMPMSSQEDGPAPIPMIEFAVSVSNTGKQRVSQLGFATHLYHDVMRDRIEVLSKHQQNVMPDDYMESSSVYIIEFDPAAIDATAQDHDTSDSTSGSVVWSELVLHAISQRVLTAQEAGALAVLLVLDCGNASSFELELDDDVGVYIPVLMVSKATLASHMPGSSAPVSFDALLKQFLALQALIPGADMKRAPSLPLVWSIRCFTRVETASRRAESAFKHGAAGVIFTDDAPWSSSIRNKTSPVFANQSVDHLIARLSEDDSQLLRSACSLGSFSDHREAAPSSTISIMPCDLQVDVEMEIRAGGTIYAWGDGENGRLGLGDLASTPFQDGYEALTDTAYRFVAQPSPIPTLAGKEMQALVCGNAHCIAVTTEGRVFTWGKGKRGELGLSHATRDAPPERPPDQDQVEPRAVTSLRFDRIIAAAANDASSFFLSDAMHPAAFEERRKEIARLRAATRKSSTSPHSTCAWPQ